MVEVSVVMPVFNSGRYISFSIESVLQQTFRNFELLIIDNGSTDSSVEIVRSAKEKDGRIKSLHCSTPGAGPARNLGIEAARGRYIAFLDSDDIWEPNKLESQLDFMKKTMWDFVGHPTY